jgi:hypothetical protein
MNRANIKGGFGSAKVSYSGDGVTTVRNSTAKDNSEESKAAKAMLKGLNLLHFDAVKFGFPIALAPLAVRKRFLTIFMVLLTIWCQKYDNALWEDEEELEFLVDAKRIQDALLPYYPV